MDIDCDKIKTGQGNLGNKGAVCVRFRIENFGTLSVSNVHLAAGQKNVAQRNMDMKKMFVEAFQPLSMQNQKRD